jgi:hypothetical protein
MIPDQTRPNVAARAESRSVRIGSASHPNAAPRISNGMTNDPNRNPGGDGETISASAASAGQKTGHIRWVLRIGTVLAIIGMAVAWMIVVPH